MMNKKELDKVLVDHKKWMNNNGGSRAYLQGAYLQGANLQGANLQGAYLQGAKMQRAYLQGADLQGADLRSAYLRSANLQGADLADVIGINQYITTPLYCLYDQTGKIRAYKLVKPNGEGPHNGGIKYEKGKSYSVKNANANEQAQCGAGINLATLDWCIKEWQEGYKILVAEFTAKDIAAIPIASDGKFRVHKCKIVGQKDLKKIGVVKKEDDK